MSVSVCECTHCNASVVHFFVIWITVSAVGFSNISGISTPRLVALFTLASDWPLGILIITKIMICDMMIII